MARIFSSGFELQSVTAGVEWDSGTAVGTIDTSVKRSGAASLLFNLTSAGNGRVAHKVVSAVTGNKLLARFAVRIATAPAANTDIASWFDNDTDWSAFIRLNTDRTLSLVNYNGTVIGTSSALELDAWYIVEFAHQNGATDLLEARLAPDDGTTPSVFATTSTNPGINVDTFIIGISWIAANTTGKLYFDDVAVNDTSGAAQTSYPSVGSIVHMQPDSAGDFNETSGDYTSVDEVTPDNATTIAVFDVNNDRLDVNCETSANAGIGAADTITLVQVGYRAAGVNANARSGKLRIKSQASGTMLESATTAVSSSAYQTNAPTPFVYKLTSYTDPQAGGAWTPTLLNSMQIGFQAIDAAPDINLSTLWALVEYVPTLSVETNSERNAKITGKTTANSERSSKLTGKATSNAERAAKLTGVATTSSERAGRLTGSVGVEVNSERSSKTIGTATSNAERAARLTGVEGSNSERSAKILGTATTESERPAKITGSQTTNSERAGKLTGKTTANSERLAKITGELTSSSERSPKIYGGYEFSVNDHFDDTANKDAGATTAKWEGDGEITLQ